ncbi:D-glycero-alpha-D-manno-heptose-1,7-bisphosphate 7-phosphatase [Cloacibacillus evryensis]|uniref:D,D-heptose 1,7-bisphosphate phosphatase n=1 Tax=Cloacibacillus evryensis TaxID=508460 RepID=A0AAW5K640_9BACT|nr:HAD family hydrolase [Cloacibacillus evryensis]EHL63737.1 histidinol-phosphate phosphatase domain-containing protein [Synergistes sp. 3_1_syn1]MCQ4815221.1 HAD family hydrolase [Cloacibacillus evryensis]
MHKIVFLDRDGVINKQAPVHDYIKTSFEFQMLPRAADAVKLLKQAGFLVVVVTNQRGIAQGIMSESDLDAIHRKMRKILADSGTMIDGIYVCPHEAGTCNCRKPEIGLFIMAENDLGKVDKLSSWMVGDGESDIEAGRRYGVSTILITDILGANKKFRADYLSTSLFNAAKLIVEKQRSTGGTR